VVGGYYSPVGDAYKKKGLAPAPDRLAMCKLAVASSNWLMVDDWECSKAEYQWTVVVLNYFHEALNKLAKYGKPVRVMLLCGADLLESFNTPGVWSDEDIKAIVGTYGVACIDRLGSSTQTTISNNDILFQHQKNIHVIPQYVPNDISSTRIRQFISRGLSIKYLVPDAFFTYIADKGLWK